MTVLFVHPAHRTAPSAGMATTTALSYVLLLAPLVAGAHQQQPAVVAFSPPTQYRDPDLIGCLYCGNWRTYRAGTKKGTWSTAIVGSPSSDPNYKGLVSSDGGRTVQRLSPVGGKAWGNPFVTMPDGSQHNTGLAGSGFANSTSSNASSSAWWNVTENGTVLAAHDGPAASFTGLPSPGVCNSTGDDCVYGAGNEGAWSQAARLADGSYVTCTAFVWLCGHFAVPAELAGIHAWISDDSFHWTWVGRAAALTELPGYSAPFDLRYGGRPKCPQEPAWFGPGEGPNEHDLVKYLEQSLRFLRGHVRNEYMY
jgi:hypothetical protein